MYHLICSSHTKTKDGLVLRNNWLQEVETDEQLSKIIVEFDLPNDFKYPSKNSISNILEGKIKTTPKAKVDEIVLHIRIVRF